MKEEIEIIKAYPEEMLVACQKGKHCSYGICDECPNILKNVKNDEDDEAQVCKKQYIGKKQAKLNKEKGD